MNEFDEIKGNLQASIQLAATDKQFRALCHGCKQAIKITEAKMTANEHTYHSDHFLCFKCQKPIDAQSEFVVAQNDNQPYHKECYMNTFAPTCVVCSQKVIDGQVITARRNADAVDSNFHNDCFKCGSLFEGGKGQTGCSKNLMSEGRYVVQDGVVFCQECHILLFADSCAGCNKKVKSTAMKVGDKQYHDECFKCFTCQKQFQDKQVYMHESKLYCLEDVRKARVTVQ